eukprot:7980503-Alexandrium_andersonii.AAC.1
MSPCVGPPSRRHSLNPTREALPVRSPARLIGIFDIGMHPAGAFGTSVEVVVGTAQSIFERLEQSGCCQDTLVQYR